MVYMIFVRRGMRIALLAKTASRSSSPPG